MAMGAVPITSRHRDSVVERLTEQFDLGPAPREGSIAGNAAWLREWRDSVIAAAGTDLRSHRLDSARRFWHVPM
jgi:hypothetical protein